jgi:hypothetical protein
VTDCRSRSPRHPRRVRIENDPPQRRAQLGSSKARDTAGLSCEHLSEQGSYPRQAVYGGRLAKPAQPKVQSRMRLTPL